MNTMTHSDSINNTEEVVEASFSLTKQLLKQHKAVLIAHYYTNPKLQKLADETGGIVSDSLEMARFGAQHPSDTLIVAGVHFMGETAKILSPDKRVFVIAPEATCSLDIGCPIESFKPFCESHPDRQVVVYANTSAAVKACSDWVVTSSIALDVVDYLSAKGEKILWAPDRHLGAYIQQQTEADMVLWKGSCIVHEEFKEKGIKQLKQLYPEAAVLVHPEAPLGVIALADVVGSTSQLLKAATKLNHSIMIVATDQGLLYKMQQAAPGKSFVIAPTGGQGATCRSCAHCPWMAMNTIQDLEQLLIRLQEKKDTASHEITLDKALIMKAKKPLQRMVSFKSSSTTINQ